jgi:hypothetical protein
MIEATYALNEYITSKWAAIDNAMVFVPGRNLDEGKGSKFVLYTVEPGRDVEFYMLNSDRVRYLIVHPVFDTLQKLVDKLLLELNVEDIEGLIVESGVRFQQTYATVSNSNSGYFTDESPYHSVKVDILLKYTLV